MRRNGFTMVELIFVIIIIGILSVAAIPKFGDIKDRAKINSEYSAMSGLESAIAAKVEFAMEDTNNIDIKWHETDYDSTSTLSTYQTVNKDKKVLKAVAKKSDNLILDAFVDLDADGAIETDTDVLYDVLFIKGEASNNITGVSKTPDIAGKPDKNDVWVLNTSKFVQTVKYWDSTLSTADVATKVLNPGDMVLIDTQGTDKISYVTADPTADGEIAIFNDGSGSQAAVTITAIP